MIHFPSTARTFLDVLGISIRHHFVVLRKTVWLIVMIVVVKDLYIYLGGMPANPIWQYFIGIVMLILLIYLFMAMLYMTNRVLRSEYVTLSDALSGMNKQLAPLYLSSLIFIIVPTLLLLLSELILHLMAGAGVDHYKYAGLIFVLVVGIPILYGYLRYFYTIPLIVMEDFPIWKAFREASQLVRKNWARVFGVYACAIAIWLLVSPDTLHGHMIQAYHISALFDFIIFCVTLPIMMNLVVFIRNDLRLRKAANEA